MMLNCGDHVLVNREKTVSVLLTVQNPKKLNILLWSTKTKAANILQILNVSFSPQIK